ncbi:hypothetical protein PsalMR5_04902 (plasmid) [Piscirickettsia salmonis]|uniref:hypothetical protein n=1 Tax=Piscirickettsia salmonis TaxID=1238 RepID=UPI0012BAC38A|nr:hypothetical protein [Piscirickettsia salmonis]QGP57382.1 hypothetical protein PsalSR1_04871 [Piscirickettsia salmonis]QGP66977.1 hypothetical protein PsalMR5_04902 [Piscirickettsia salmonis]
MPLRSRKIIKRGEKHPAHFELLQSKCKANIDAGVRSKSEIHRVDETMFFSERAPNMKTQANIAPLTPFFKHLLQSELSSRGGLDYKSEVNDDIAKEISSFCM